MHFLIKEWHMIGLKTFFLLDSLHFYRLNSFNSFLTPIFFFFQLLTAFTIIALTEARKFVIQSKPSDTEKLFDKNSFTFSQDKDDTKDPTIFTGDVQKSKTVIAENYASKNKDFKFA